MKRIFLNRTLSILYLSLLVFSSQAFSWSTLTNELDITCQQITKKLECEYRTLNDVTASSINAISDDTKLEVTNNKQYPESGDTTAILFLVDTSDPERKNVIEKNRIHIKEILTTLKPHHKAGLASFDKSLKVQSPIGTSTFLLSKSVDSIKASGKTTELYRNLLKAIEHLNSFEAQRKVIVLLSDGQAEDKAYFHSDVIKMARKFGITINSIGYPRSVALSVALQTIRRLSEETGGKYSETDTTYDLPNQNLKDFFNNIDSGGSFSVVLDELYQGSKPTDSVTLSVTTKTGVKRIKIPVKINIENRIIKEQANLPVTKNPVAVQPYANTAMNAPIQIITKQPTTQPINLWIWYGLPAAFIIIIIFILITLYLLWRKPDQQVSNSKNDYKPYAYLIANDGTEKRYPITRTICRIGRSKDNELSLDDTSISRRHAEIHRNNDGTFDIIDMNSMNGVYVNNEKVGKAELHEGDTLEIGDFFLHFTQLASDYSLEESTVMQKTRTPTH